MIAELTREQPTTPNLSRDHYRQFVQAHETAVYTFCMYMLGDAQKAEATAEAAFVDSYPTDAHLHVLANAYRRLQHTPLPSTVAEGLPPLIEKLSSTDRALIALRYGCHLRPAELSIVTGIPINQIRQQLYRARLQMASQLAA